MARGKHSCGSCRCAVLVLRPGAFLSSSQDHALDQRVRDIGRMSKDRRPLFLRQQLGHLADQSVSQWMQLIDQPDIVRARAKVERPLWRQAILDWGFWILD